MIVLFDRASWPLLQRVTKRYLRPHVGRVALAMVFMMLAAGMTAVFAKLIEPVLDHVLIAKNENLVVPLALGVMACFVLRGLTTYAHTLIMGQVGQDIVARIQTETFESLMQQDLAFFHARSSGDLLSRVTADVNVMRVAVAEGLTSAGKSTLTLLLLVGVMLWQDWRLALFALTVFPLAMAFVARVGKRLRKISYGTQNSSALLASQLSQVFQAMRQVKAYTAEATETQRVAQRAREVCDLAVKNVKVGTLSTPVNDVLVGIIVVGLILYAAGGVGAPRLSPGALMSFIAAFLMAYEPMKRIAKTNNAIQTGLGAAQRVFEVMDHNPSILDAPNALTLNPAMPDVAFENVMFQYEGSDRVALNGVSFFVPAGQTVALVGASGSGKSTCFNLILRLYDPKAGGVHVAGQNVRNVTQASLRQAIGLVSQEVVVFDDTAAGNIAYGMQGVSLAAVEAAARAAYAHEFLSALPQGYQTRLGENGVTLSGGQRQRIALARAFLKNAPILLLDEATSALDSESERLVQESLERLKKGRTTLVIAHRLTTVRHADKILVFDKGQIVEQGTHETLVATGGVYAKLYQQYEVQHEAA